MKHVLNVSAGRNPSEAKKKPVILIYTRGERLKKTNIKRTGNVILIG